MATREQHITVLVGPTCTTCEADDLTGGVPDGAPSQHNCRDCGTEYLWYETPGDDPSDPACQCCGAPLPERHDPDAPCCEDCEPVDCMYCGTTVQRFDLSDNAACRVCETGEVAA